MKMLVFLIKQGFCYEFRKEFIDTLVYTMATIGLVLEKPKDE
jgi:hypothetical protein